MEDTWSGGSGGPAQQSCIRPWAAFRAHGICPDGRTVLEMGMDGPQDGKFIGAPWRPLGLAQPSNAGTSETRTGEAPIGFSYDTDAGGVGCQSGSVPVCASWLVPLPSRFRTYMP